MTTEATLEQLRVTRQRAHDRCVVCGRNGPGALGLDFTVNPDGSVSASFTDGSSYEGYAGVLHGGVLSAVVDGAMTNCLFAHGIEAVTGELTVRFRRPVLSDAQLTVTARLAPSKPPLYYLEAEISQHGEVKVVAKAKFMDPA